MASINKPLSGKITHEGGKAYSGYMPPIKQLRRTVLSCLLWEDTFYEDGKSVVERIKEYALQVSPKELASLAIEARVKFNLRHVPLVLLSVLCQTGKGTSLVSDTFPKVINRADELSEFVVVYSTVNGVTPDKVKKKLSAQAKKGLAKAFIKFDAYSLQKYNRDGAVKLRDVMFLCHPKAKDAAQRAVHKQLADNTLPTPDTWETALSNGADKKETFTRLINQGDLGYLALLRNLRNMVESGVDDDLIKKALTTDHLKGRDKVFPFRFTAAARAVPKLEPVLDNCLVASIGNLPKLTGLTVVLVDVSGSMNNKMSGKSDLSRIDAAATLAGIIPSDNMRLFTFSSTLKELPPRKGMACVDLIKSVFGGSTFLRKAIEEINRIVKYDRIIVITDEQSRDGIANPLSGSKAYLINVASNKNGVGYGAWNHIDGFSENVLRYIYEIESED